MALLNMTSDTKFQFIAKIVEINEEQIKVSDGSEDINLYSIHEKLVDLDIGDTVIVFGEKINSKIKEDRILRINLEWDLFQKTREFESL